jgi:acetolactate decarboxylase
MLLACMLRACMLVACIILAAPPGPARAQSLDAMAEPPERNTLYQVSTIQALLNGNYDGAVSFEELAAHGGFGIGTFHKLDGEMVALDGQFWQVTHNGRIKPVDGSMTTPFAAVTSFEPDLELTLRYVKDLDDFTHRLEKELPGRNMFYAIRVDGLIQYVKTRSVPAQEPPYPPLAEVTAHQSTFQRENTMGTLVGFYTPECAGTINVPGFHIHYLDEAREFGGHVLDLSSLEIVVKVDRTPNILVHMPLATAGAELTDRSHELDEVEK